MRLADPDGCGDFLGGKCARPEDRIPSLDLIRGFALFGVLAFNSAYFAAPLASVINPGYGPLVTEIGNSLGY